MKLHYSQTLTPLFITVNKFQYLMKLHYSQTVNDFKSKLDEVSVPYEITLLSNGVSVPVNGSTGFSTL